MKPNGNFSEESLPGHLTNDQVKEDEKQTLPVSDSKKGKRDQKNPAKKEDAVETKDKSATEDYQLSRALDLIRALSIYQRQGEAPAAAKPEAAAPSTESSAAPVPSKPTKK